MRLFGHNSKESKEVETRWGKCKILFPEKEIVPGVKIQVKRLSILPDRSISLQYHNHRSEVWKVISGDGMLLTTQYSHLKPGDVIAIAPGSLHRVWGGKNGIEIQEVWIGDKLSEDDITRLA